MCVGRAYTYSCVRTPRGVLINIVNVPGISTPTFKSNIINIDALYIFNLSLKKIIMVAHTHQVTACRDGCQTLQLTRSLASGPGSSLMCPAHGTASGLGIRPHAALFVQGIL